MADKKESQNTVEQRPESANKNAETLPALLEATSIFSRLVIVAVGSITFVLSLLAGTQVWMASMRSGLAIFSLGLIFWGINWLLSRNSLQAFIADLKAAEQAAGESTVERRA